MRWHTKAGKILSVEDMDTGHIINAQRQILARIEDCEGEMGSCYGHGLSEDSMAAREAENSGDELWYKMEDLCVTRDAFSEELRKRNIDEAEVLS